jgi:TRAP-type C4-dicarboxylate transport system permease small subunit
MQEPIAELAPAPVRFGLGGQVLHLIAKVFAAIGGLMFVGLVAMSIVSIVGRKLFSAPVPGDVEMLQMLAAAACANFFAYCHLSQGDVNVDFFTATAPKKVNHLLDALGSGLLALVAAVLTWRIYVGARETIGYGEVSAIIGWPIGWAQMAMVPGFAVFTLSGLYMSLRHLRAAMTERDGTEP